MRSAPACRKAGGGVFCVPRPNRGEVPNLHHEHPHTGVESAFVPVAREIERLLHTSGLKGETFYGDGTAGFSTNGCQELIFVGPARLGARSKLMVPNGVNLHLRNSA
ncbi:hypothetical protein FHT77_001652 [Rhizobium sp. BK181]|nr:hypothetical protein [Rhizobium sp. BK181]